MTDAITAIPPELLDRARAVTITTGHGSQEIKRELAPAWPGE